MGAKVGVYTAYPPAYSQRKGCEVQLRGPHSMFNAC
jgi:hypothetical protein